MKEKIISLFLILIILLELILSICSITYFNYIKSILWSIVTILLVLTGIYFSIKLKFIQFNLKKIFTSLFTKNKGNISTFESLSINLAAKIGVGSLSGIALSIFIGGAGTIFWMWVITIITAVIAYIEGYLGIKYQTKKNNELIGGPSFYIKKISNGKTLAYLYSLLIIISYILGFITIQSNTIIKSLNYIFNIDKYIVLTILVLITGLIIFKGIKNIAVFSSLIVPIMGIIYIILGIYIIITNINIIPSILLNILKEAFNLKSITGGIITTIIIGVQRGLFATEVGLGTSAISASLTNDTKENQGFVQLFSIYFTSLVICTITALIILTSKASIVNYLDFNGIEYVIESFIYHLGNIGTILFVLITILFAFSTIVSGYCFGELALDFIYKKVSKTKIIIFKIITLILVFIGGILRANILWNLIDILIAILTIINIYAIYKLRNNIN